MQLHPRTLKVQEAGAEIGLAVVKLAEKHDLTAIEVMKCLLQCAQSWNTMSLREERHPENPDHKADEA